MQLVWSHESEELSMVKWKMYSSTAQCMSSSAEYPGAPCDSMGTSVPAHWVRCTSSVLLHHIPASAHPQSTHCPHLAALGLSGTHIALQQSSNSVLLRLLVH